MLKKDRFVVSGDDGKRHYYYMALRDNNVTRAYSLAFPIDSEGPWQAITVAMANSFIIGTSAPPYVASSENFRQPQNASSFLDRTSLIGIANGFLADAGITTYKFLPNRADDPYLTWAYEDGSIGELMALRPRAGLPLKDVANLAIQRQAKACKGEFATARLQSRYFKGSEVQRVETRCKNGSTIVAVNFSIIELPTGAIIQFGSMAPANRALADTASKRSDKVGNAAIAYVGSKPDAVR